MTKYYCTPEGYSDLSSLYKRLRSQRPDLVERMAEITKEGGSDLSENSDYLCVKEELDMLEKRISDLDEKLGLSSIINIKEIKETGKVMFGSTVYLFDIDNEKDLTYKIVGIDESNIKENKISLQSPIAKELIGKSIGDEIDLVTPIGERFLEIRDIKHI
jgi:transcription elongation factor GreA